MAFPKSKILNTQQFVRQIIESNRNGERFCFILGSGASVESGIPSGNTLEMRWMDCLMGKADDLNYPAMDPDDTRQYGAALYEDGLLEHKFDEIEAAWQHARKKGTVIPSEYYFDIFKLRFYPNQRNGYRYLERIMDSCTPSLGYHTLALLLADSTQNNLVITTNFDSLVEDALFLYTDKKPLVVSHESLAGFIESDIQRPIIAKVHRGLMYAPFNTPDATSKLKKEWRKALLYAFNTYTPVVIGYGGGDRSLMSFLEEETTIMPHGVYWCYHEPSGFPDDKVCNFISDKNGYLVRTAGFDALMLKLGTMVYKNEISYTGTKAYLKDQCDHRIQQYHSQLAELSKQPVMSKELRSVNTPTPSAEKKQEAPAPRQSMVSEPKQSAAAEAKQSVVSEPKQSMTPEAKQSVVPEPKQSAATEIRQPMAAEPRLPVAAQPVQPASPVIPQPTAAEYHQSAAPAVSQSMAAEYHQPVAPVVPQSVQPAAPVVPQPIAAEYHQPLTPVVPQPMAAEHRQPAAPVIPQSMQPAAPVVPQSMAAEYHQPVAPVVPQPMATGIPQPTAADIRQSIFTEFRQPETPEPRQPAVRTRPAAPSTAKSSDSRAQLGAAYYIRQGNRACETRDFDRAIASYQQATRLDPGYALAYYNCGVVYNILHRYDEAIASCSKAIALDPNHVSAYTTRGIAYKNLGQMEEAIGDYTSALELNPTDASAYNNRGNAYFALGQHQIAVDDYTKAIEYNPSFKRAYLNRAIAYRALGDTSLADADKITAEAL